MKRSIRHGRAAEGRETGRGGGAPRQTGNERQKDFLFGSTRRSTTRCSDGPPPSFAASTDRSSICSVARCRTRAVCPDRIRRIRRLPVRGRSAIDSAGIPAALLKPTPRHVRVNASGGTMLIIAAALVVIGGWGGSELQTRADVAATTRQAVRVRARLDGRRRGRAAQARRRQRPSHHRSLPVCGSRPGADGTSNACGAGSEKSTRWDRRSLSGISRPNRNRAGSMAIRPGPNQAGPALSSRSHAASLP